MENKIYLAWLHYIWISQKKLNNIFENNSDYKIFFENLSSDGLKKNWFNDNQINWILKRKDNINLELLKKKITSRKVKIVTILDSDYPDEFKNISNKPYLFYLRWFIEKTPKFSIVWARKITSYWEKVIDNIIPDLSKYFITVSWWAAWCDTFIHKSTIKNNNKTISIIWTWIDIDYPVSNKELFNEIVNTWWWVISIFPLGEVWNPYNFPIRNELVAALWTWTLVIEAAKKSWTLITANFSLELWKDLFVVPWDIFNVNSLGCNNLIKTWSAKLVTSYLDILDEYNFSNIIESKRKETRKINLSDELEENIFNALSLESLSLDQVSLKLNKNITELSSKISIMEIKWIIKKVMWWKYQIK